MHVAINSSGFMHNVPVGNSNKHIFKFSKFQSEQIHLSHYCSLRTITNFYASEEKSFPFRKEVVFPWYHHLTVLLI